MVLSIYSDPSSSFFECVPTKIRKRKRLYHKFESVVRRNGQCQLQHACIIELSLCPSAYSEGCLAWLHDCLQASRIFSHLLLDFFITPAQPWLRL